MSRKNKNHQLSTLTVGFIDSKGKKKKKRKKGKYNKRKWKYGTVQIRGNIDGKTVFWKPDCWKSKAQYFGAHLVTTCLTFSTLFTLLGRHLFDVTHSSGQIPSFLSPRKSSNHNINNMRYLKSAFSSEFDCLRTGTNKTSIYRLYHHSQWDLVRQNCAPVSSQS